MTWRIGEWDVMKTPWPIEPESVQCVVSSPPYWGLRDYGTATWEGGDAECDHLERTAAEIGKSSTLQFGNVKPDNQAFQARERQFKNECPKCGARRIDFQIGLEPTPDEYVEKIVAVFREVRRVLRKDGTVWLNLGDSFYSNTKGSGGKSDKQDSNAGSRFNAGSLGLKTKDLVGIPWHVAFALQADGWWLRSDIIWAKPNPMPESVTDRPTRAHEYIFLLTKSARYFYDADTIRTKTINSWNPMDGVGRPRAKANGMSEVQLAMQRTQFAHNTHHDDEEKFGANARTVWSIATEPYSEAHFATFPTELARRCILAGSREGDLVLDPFSGSGTVALVADTLGRDAIGLELNPTYIEMARRRVLAPRSDGEKERRAMEDEGQITLFDGDAVPADA